MPYKKRLKLLLHYLQPWKARVTLLFLSLLAEIALQLANPQLLRVFIDTAIAGKDIEMLVLIGVLFLCFALTNQGISIATSYLSTSVAWRATNKLRIDLIAHCLSLDIEFHKTHTPGEMIERVDGDVTTLTNFFSRLFVTLCINALVLFCILILFFTIHWFIGLIMTLFSIVSLFVIVRLRNQAIPHWEAYRQMSATFYGFLKERIQGIEDIVANGTISDFMSRFYRLLHRWFPIFRKALLTGTTMNVTTLFLFGCANVLALSIGTYLWSRGTITIGTVYLLFAYTEQLSQPIQQIQVQMQDLQRADASLQRIEHLLATHSKIEDGPGSQIPDGALSVDFENVTFGYVEKHAILHNLTVHIPPSRFVGIVGKTGSGKTSLVRLLFRLYDPQSGEIRVGDIPIRQAHLQNLRQRIGMITQDIQIFNATLRDNITFFDPSIQDKHVLTSLEKAGLSLWYQSLPQGLDTLLGDAGQGISAGEAQLLAFARVFLTDPGLVILDEASSRLDPITERHMDQALQQLFAGRTALVIAHRLATLEHADDILILEEGHIIEYGSRSSLANDSSSHFYQLLQTGLKEMIP